MKSSVTLKQVAAQAGVSYQTVSKVLNQKGQVSKETEERIWQSIRALGYRPNQIARSLRSHRSRLIGYSWEPAPSDQVNPILDQFLQSMSHAAESAGYHLLTFPYRAWKEEWLGSYRELIDTNRVDGFVLSSVEYDDPRIAFLLERKFPFIAFGRSNPDWEFPFVDIDGGAGMRMVVDHLVELGHRCIAALAWPELSRVGQNRLDGFLEALHAAGIPTRKDYIARGEGTFRFGYEAANAFLTMHASERPTAIVAFNDAMAVGAIRALQENGIPVGRDIAVTGFDDTPMVQYLTPPLTSVRQPIWEVGQQVISILLGSLEDSPPLEQRVLLEPQLIIRQSSNERMPALDL